MKRLILAAALLLSGCAGGVEHWIVDTRVNQGDAAADRGSLHEAQTAYRLALRVDPHDVRARAGFSTVSADIAEADYRKGNFDDAMTTITEAQRYDRQSVRLQALRSQIEQARLNREIVISNYPSYGGAGVQLQTAYASLDEQTKAILTQIKRFGYTYDTQALTRAIEQSYEMELDVAKNTNRLIAYRQLVESGLPSASQQTQTTQPSGSLLPLP